MRPIFLSSDLVEAVSENLSPETKHTLKGVIQLMFSDKFYHAIFLIIMMVVMLKIVDLVFKPLTAKKNNIHLNFLRSIIKVLIVITILIRIGSMSEALAQFYSSILMSSSLIVVVLGFIFQEGLSNVVHGFLLTLSKPFNIGDRLNVIIDGQQITGYVKSISLRNTIIQTISNNSIVIIPNAKMDMCIIDNSYFDNATRSNFLDISVTYESNIEKAMQIMSETISIHPMVLKARTPEERRIPVNVLVSCLGDSSVNLRASVVTSTIEENFQACSDIRRTLLARFAEEDDVEFAYPHMDVTIKKQ